MLHKYYMDSERDNSSTMEPVLAHELQAFGLMAVKNWSFLRLGLGDFQIFFLKWECIVCAR